jgi:hypothetical protein
MQLGSISWPGCAKGKGEESHTVLSTQSPEEVIHSYLGTIIRGIGKPGGEE